MKSIHFGNFFTRPLTLSETMPVMEPNLAPLTTLSLCSWKFSHIIVSETIHATPNLKNVIDGICTHLSTRHRIWGKKYRIVHEIISSIFKTYKLKKWNTTNLFQCVHSIPTNSPTRSSFEDVWRHTTRSLEPLKWITISWSPSGVTLSPVTWIKYKNIIISL